MMRVAIIVLILALTEGCAPAKGAGGSSAQYVPGPAGYDCIGFFDGDGRLAGGSCVKN
jgi:hypothetical protein